MSAVKDALVVIAAIAGGALGFLGFYWLEQQGFYGLVLPGGLAGIAAGIMKSRHPITPYFCGLVGLAAGLLAEWRCHPFVADESLVYFLTHLHSLKPLTLIMLAVGTGIAFVIPFRNRSVSHLPVRDSQK